MWPGQACTYMLGKLTFLAQRARAQKALGAKYDIRKFHDAMLLPGAVPLEAARAHLRMRAAGPDAGTTALKAAPNERRLYL